MTKTTDDRNSVAISNKKKTKTADDKNSVGLNKGDKTARYIIREKEYVSHPSAIDMIPRKIGECRYTCKKLDGIQPETSKTASRRKGAYYKSDR